MSEIKGSFWRPNTEHITLEQSENFPFIYNLKFHHNYRRPDIIQFHEKELKILKKAIMEILK